MPQDDLHPQEASFQGLGEALSAHNTLLHACAEAPATHDQHGGAESFFAQARSFIDRAVATGAVLESSAERQVLQGQIDYWVGFLRTRGRPISHVTLAPFKEPDLSAVECPYPGLRTLREGEAPFGRESLVNDLAARLREAPMLALVGASGTGKSSLVIAGLLPELRAQVLRPAEGWVYLDPITPGSDPLGGLAQLKELGPKEQLDGAKPNALRSDPHALLQLLDRAGIAHAVLFIDQFEEVFTLVPDAKTCEAYLAGLVALVAAPGHPHRLIVTMRSEFQYELDRYADFAKLFEQHATRLYKMSPGELREAIEGPAEKVGLRFDDGLVDELVEQIAPDPSGLPLLQFTLRTLWESKRRARVTWESYRVVGNARKALANEAERRFNQLSPNSQSIAKDIFVAVVVLDEKGEPLRKRVPLKVLHQLGHVEWVDQIVESYCADPGLLLQTPGSKEGGQSIELAHEALPRYWERFSDWLKDNKAYIEGRQRFARQAREWDATGRRAEALVVRGRYLDQATTYKDLQPFEEDFLHANELVARRARRHERQRVSYGAAALFLLIAALAALAWALHLRSADKARALLAQAESTEDPGARLDLALQAFDAVRSRPLPEVTRALARAFQEHSKALSPRSRTEPMWADPDAVQLKFGDKGPESILFSDMAIPIPEVNGFANVGVLPSARQSRPRVAVLRYPSAPPDPGLGATWVGMGPSRLVPQVQIYEPNGGKLEPVRDVIRIDGCNNEPPVPRLLALKLSPDGAVLTYTCSQDNRVLVWPTSDQATTKARAEAVRSALELSKAYNVFFERDGRRFTTVSSGGSLTAWAWDEQNLQKPVAHVKYLSDFLSVYSPLDVSIRGDNRGFAVLDPMFVVTYFEIPDENSPSTRGHRVSEVFRLSVNDQSRPPAIGLSFYRDKCLWVKRQNAEVLVEDYPVDREVLYDSALRELKQTAAGPSSGNPCRPG